MKKKKGRRKMVAGRGKQHPTVPAFLGIAHNNNVSQLGNNVSLKTHMSSTPMNMVLKKWWQSGAVKVVVVVGRSGRWW